MSLKKTLSVCTSVILIGGLGVATAATPAMAQSVTFEEGSHSWVVPNGITSIDLAVLGGGGASGKFGNPDASPSGGAGAKVTVKNMKVTPGETIKFGIGTGGSSSIPNAGGGGGAASIVYKGEPTTNGLLVVAGGGGGGGSMADKTVGKGADGAANGTAAGGSTTGNPGPIDGGCGGSQGGSAGQGGIVADPRSCVTQATAKGGDGLFGNGGAGGGANNGGSLDETGTATGGAGGEHNGYYGGGGGGGYGGGAGGVARGNPVNTGVGGAAGGSGVFGVAKQAKVVYAPGTNGGTRSGAGSHGSVVITWGNSGKSKPKQPAKVSVSGKASAAKRTVSWKAPKSGVKPTGYRVTIKVKHSGKKVYLKNVKASVKKVTVSRSYLLKKTFRSRGEVRGNIRYVAYVQAKNGNALGKARATTFTVRG